MKLPKQPSLRRSNDDTPPNLSSRPTRVAYPRKHRRRETADLTFHPPQDLLTCTPVNITWSSTLLDEDDADPVVELYAIRIGSKDSRMADSVVELGTARCTDNTFSWDLVNVPAGTYVYGANVDPISAADSYYSGQFQVQPGPSTACIGLLASSNSQPTFTTDGIVWYTGSTSGSQPSGYSGGCHSGGGIGVSPVAAAFITLAVIAAVGFGAYLFVWYRRRRRLIREAGGNLEFDGNVSVSRSSTGKFDPTTTSSAGHVRSASDSYSQELKSPPSHNPSLLATPRPRNSSLSVGTTFSAGGLTPVRRNPKYKSDVLPPRPESTFSNLQSPPPPPPVPPLPPAIRPPPKLDLQTSTMSSQSPSVLGAIPVQSPSSSTSAQPPTSYRSPIQDGSDKSRSSTVTASQSPSSYRALENREPGATSLSRSGTEASYSSSLLPSITYKETTRTGDYGAARADSDCGALPDLGGESGVGGNRSTRKSGISVGSGKSARTSVGGPPLTSSNRTSTGTMSLRSVRSKRSYILARRLPEVPAWPQSGMSINFDASQDTIVTPIPSSILASFPTPPPPHTASSVIGSSPLKPP